MRYQERGRRKGGARPAKQPPWQLPTVALAAGAGPAPAGPWTSASTSRTCIQRPSQFMTRAAGHSVAYPREAESERQGGLTTGATGVRPCWPLRPPEALRLRRLPAGTMFWAGTNAPWCVRGCSSTAQAGASRCGAMHPQCTARRAWAVVRQARGDGAGRMLAPRHWCCMMMRSYGPIRHDGVSRQRIEQTK
jgi:hypothetical protein